MQDAVPPDKGSMIAILGINIEEVEKEISLLPKDGICEIANDNSNSQVVVSGTKEKINILNENLKKKKKRSILLPVSAPFHCSLMKNAAIEMKDKIQKSVFNKPNPIIISILESGAANNS